MKTDVEELSPTRVRLSVEVSFEELKPSLDKAYKEVAQQARIPGFRPGKVPPRVIDMRIGRGAVLTEAVNDALPEFYSKAVQEAEVFVLGQPDVEITQLDDGKELTFTAEVEVRPKFELPDFATLSVTVDNAEVTDADVEEYLNNLRERFASLKTAQRPGGGRRLHDHRPVREPGRRAHRGRAGDQPVVPDRQRRRCSTASTRRSPACPRAIPRRSRASWPAARPRARRPTSRSPCRPSRSRSCPRSTTTSRSSRASSTRSTS